MKEAKILSFVNSKGGCSKSTSTILVAGCLAKEGKKVLVLDADNQGSVIDTYEIEKQDCTPLFEVEAITPNRIEAFIKRFKQDYDFIFIDVPRITSEGESKGNTFLLYACEFVFVPVIGSQLDVMSTLDFLEILKEVQKNLNQYNHSFTFSGFIARRNRRKDNDQAESLLNDSGLPMMKNSISDLKLFANVSTCNCILDSTEGKERFEDFYNEFKKIVYG